MDISKLYKGGPSVSAGGRVPKKKKRPPPPHPLRHYIRWCLSYCTIVLHHHHRLAPPTNYAYPIFRLLSCYETLQNSLTFWFCKIG